MKLENSQLLRFTTAGSVDDGKSTLIGRLLYDSKSIFEDQLSSVEATTKRKGQDGIDLALFTDGLKDERAQGITIDVAYRYFTTPKRKFIIADTPGHIQYTRNMVTGASTANAALILIDARHGVVEQTKRHSFIASLLQIPHVIVCINKMDLVDFSQDRFEEICLEYEALLSKMDIKDVRFIPISALKGDNIVNRSENMDWYEGAPLLSTLESLHISSDINKIDARFPVQYVTRPQTDEYHDFRGFSGRIESGILRENDEVVVLPSGISSRIKSIQFYENQLEEAFAPSSVTVLLEDDIDVSRGDMIVKKNNQPKCEQEFDAMICWLNNNPARLNAKYSIRHTTNEQKAIIKDVVYKINMNTLERESDDKIISTNEICRISLKTAKPLMIDSYRENRVTGSFVLIDEATNETVAAGMII
ncbi:MAG: sulfate adenylyltransferase subunit 1 [Flavobacterium sp.]